MVYAVHVPVVSAAAAFLQTAARAAAALLLAVAAILFLWQDALAPYRFIFYSSASYASHGLTAAQGLITRLLWYILAAGMTGAILCLTPHRRFFFTYLGERTLSIYILHILLRNIVKFLRLYDVLGEGWRLLLPCIVFSAAVTFLTSGRRINKLVNMVFRIPWGGSARRE